jgi:hypothetical protein
MFLQVYDDIQQELSLKTDALRKNKIKVKWNIFTGLWDSDFLLTLMGPQLVSM